MRHRGLTLFLSGVITGAVGLYLLLAFGGVLSPYLEQVNAKSAEQVAQAPPPAVHPRIEAPRLPKASAPPPDEPGIVLPIEGLKPEDILDTFNQERSAGRTHEATDIMKPRGTPVVAMVDGVIEKLFTSKPGGLTIYEFDKAREYAYYYAHLDHYAEGIHEGMEVARGTVIAYVGSTGNANPDAPHLHLAIFQLGPEKQWWKGTAIDPYPILMRALKTSK